MLELALHILDIVENGLAAGASLISILVHEDRRRNRLEIVIRDNGRGMPAEKKARALDPFYTTRTTRRVGLGLSLFRELTMNCEGDFRLDSQEGQGTEVNASFRMNHIDLPPLGDMAASLSALIMGNEAVDFYYRHQVGEEVFELDTREVKGELDGLPISHPEVVRYLRDGIREALAGMQAGQFAAPSAE